MARDDGFPIEDNPKDQSDSLLVEICDEFEVVEDELLVVPDIARRRVLVHEAVVVLHHELEVADELLLCLDQLSDGRPA